MGRQRGVSRTSWGSVSDCTPTLGAMVFNHAALRVGDRCSSIALTVLRAALARPNESKQRVHSQGGDDPRQLQACGLDLAS
jgi:hypothetical protein